MLVIVMEWSEERTTFGHSRTVVHIDVDCFYAQVEMIRHHFSPDKPLGVQQKNIVVTCNYKARGYGVTKCMLVSEALRKCPDLHLVCGEDLTNYRNVSYQISGILRQFSPLVERLGFDENFIDVSDAVKMKNEAGKVVGNVYDNISESVEEEICECGCHDRLTLGTCIAKEMRDAIFQELGLTCCAGIAHNKLLSKLVGSMHKPNQQTVLFPESADSLLLTLQNVKSIPGIGGATAEKLAKVGIVKLDVLRNCELKQIEILGKDCALHLKKLSLGIDDSPVIATGKPQSHSLEDSFKKCTTIEECRHRLEALVGNLLKRVIEDTRTPRTVRLTLRQKMADFTSGFQRQTRQCPLPSDLMKKLSEETVTVVQSKIVELLLVLLRKMICEDKNFCLTLLGVCFSSLTDTDKSSNKIETYFCSALKASTSKDIGQEVTSLPANVGPTPEKSIKCNIAITQFLQAEKRSKTSTLQSAQYEDIIPEGIDREVFEQLPIEVKEEILQSWRKDSTSPQNIRESPVNIDPSVLEELPENIRAEILSNYSQKGKHGYVNRKKSTLLNYFQKL